MRSRTTPAASGRRCPPWSSPVKRPAIRPWDHCAPVRSGSRGGRLRAVRDQRENADRSRPHRWETWARVGLNFVVPFLVASYGYLTAARIPR